MRPLIQTNSSLRIDDHGSSKYHFDISGVTAFSGNDAKLECPITGYPKPEIEWKLINNQNLDVSLYSGFRGKTFCKKLKKIICANSLFLILYQMAYKQKV